MQLRFQGLSLKYPSAVLKVDWVKLSVFWTITGELCQIFSRYVT